jgi:sporulation integral membrane protein YtvI
VTFPQYAVKRLCIKGILSHYLIKDKKRLGLFKRKGGLTTEKEKRFLIRAAYGAMWLVLLYLAFRYLAVWLLPFLIALGLAAIMEPCILLFRSKLHFRRGFSAAILTIVLLGALITLLVLLISRLLGEAYELLTRLPQMLSSLPEVASTWQQQFDRFCATCPESLQRWIVALSQRFGEQLAVFFDDFSQQCLEGITGAVAALPRLTLFCATTALAVLFTTSRFPDLMRFLRRQLPGSRLDRMRGVKSSLLTTLGKWLRAELLLFLITFVQLLAGLLLIRQPYGLLLAALIALVDALPVFGVGTILLPWSVGCLLLGQVPKGIALAALYAMISLVRSIAEPHLMAAQAGLPPLPALMAMYIGFSACGIWGMILFPLLLLFLHRLSQEGYLHLWK